MKPTPIFRDRGSRHRREYGINSGVSVADEVITGAILELG